MKHFFERVKSFCRRVSWYSRLKPSPFHACYDLVAIKINPKIKLKAQYKRMNFCFSSSDMSAVKEVLIDQEYNFLKQILVSNSSPTILDIGANIGTFSLWVLGENKNSKIISLEASSETFKTLTHNIDLQNSVDWHAIQGAAWKNNDEILFSNKGDSMGHRVDKSGELRVSGITLGDLVEDNCVDVLKIDIEGAEEFFLIDNEKTRNALNKVKSLVVELHPNSCNTDDVTLLLRSMYKNIERQDSNRMSTKPLLYCY